MSHYGQYRGRSVGRVLHCLETYTKPFPRIDETQVGDGCVTLHGKLFAEYTWPATEPSDFDTPTFTWDASRNHRLLANGLFDESTIAEFEKKQAILQPFVDDMFLRDLATWLVQQVRDQISFSHALLIRFVRDRLKGNWDDLAYSPKKGEWMPREEVERILNREFQQASAYIDRKAKLFISGKPYEETLQQFVKDYWQHFALCAVLDI